MSGMDTYLEYARRGRNDWWRYVLTLALSIFLALLAGTGLMLAMILLAHVDIGALSSELTSARDPIRFFIANGVLFAIMAASLVVFARVLQGKRFGDLVGKVSWSYFARGFGVWLLIELVGTGIDYMLAPGGFRVTVSAGTWALGAAAAVGLFAQTFAEELYFRGFVTQGLLLATRRPMLASLLSGLIFGVVHIPNGGPQAVGAVIFGVAAAYIAIRTGGIACTLGVHFANNLFGAVVVVSGQDVFKGAPGVLTQNTPSLVWWDVVVELASFAIVTFILVRYVAGRAARPA
jgi:uncharacterized protein